VLGKTFGRLAVIAGPTRNAQGRLLWECMCACGSISVVSGTNLRLGVTQSCGCFRNECASVRSTTHGLSKTLEYSSWSVMMHRCYNPKRADYPHYGGRGITVCRAWHSVEGFLKDMGPRPTPTHTIERRKNAHNYTPANCFWETRMAQAQNRRNTIWLVHAGKKQSLSVWAREVGAPWSTLQYRHNAGWSDRETIYGRRA